MRTTRAPNNGKNAPPVRACRFTRAKRRSASSRQGAMADGALRLPPRPLRLPLLFPKISRRCDFREPYIFPFRGFGRMPHLQRRQNRQARGLAGWCNSGIHETGATICKIEVPGPCGPDTPNVCKKPFCVCKIDK